MIEFFKKLFGLNKKSLAPALPKTKKPARKTAIKAPAKKPKKNV